MTPDDRAPSGNGAISDRHALRSRGSLDGVPADPSRPWTWSAPLLAIGRTPVRMHASFMALVLLQALRIIRPGPSGPLPDSMSQMLVALVTLAWLALLADAVREWASRLCGAPRGTIVLWPAGGLSWREAPGHWSTRLSVALAGPVTSTCVSIALGLALLRHSGRWDVAVPVPWSMRGLEALAADRLWSTLWLVHWTNVSMLAATLIPAHPFAGGRIAESALEPWLGRDGALRATLVLGMLTGITLLIAGLAFGSLLAILCGATAVTLGMSGGRSIGLRPGMAGLGLWTMVASDASAAKRTRAAVRKAGQARDDDAAIDAILDKVARSGMGSLTRQERAVLARTTARRRAGHERGPMGDAKGTPDADHDADGEQPAAS
jgi:hypothetical protein